MSFLPIFWHDLQFICYYREKKEPYSFEEDDKNTRKDKKRLDKKRKYKIRKDKIDKKRQDQDDKKRQNKTR